MRETKYTIHLGKGCGLVDETLALLSICDSETTKESLANYVHEQNFLSKCTDLRSQDIVKRVFYPRFMKRNSQVPYWLRLIRDKGLLLADFKQLLMIYCARENAIMFDFICQKLNLARGNHEHEISGDCRLQFVKDIVEKGEASWSESIQKRQARYIKSVLVDFDMLSKRGEILPYELSDFTLLYLIHELHFEGLSDMAIWNHEDWQLFDIDKYQLQQRILDKNLTGGYIAQCSGELLTISWNYKSMEEFINGTL